MMQCNHPVIRSAVWVGALLVVGAVTGCAPREPLAPVTLTPTRPLGATENAGWRGAQAERLEEFRRAHRRLRWAIERELHGRIPVDWPPPHASIRWNGYDYGSSDSPGQRYPIFYRRTPAGALETVLDLNLAFPTTLVQLGALRIAPDHSQIAFSLDVTGRGEFALYTSPIGRSEIRGPHASAVYEFEWGAGGDLFYTTLTDLRATELFRLPPSGAPRPVGLTAGPTGHLALRRGGPPTSLVVREISPEGGRVWGLTSTPPDAPLRDLAPPTLARGEFAVDGCPLDDGAVLVTRRGPTVTLFRTRRAGGAPAEPLLGPLTDTSFDTVRCFDGAVVVGGQARFRPALWRVTIDAAGASVDAVELPREITAIELGAPTSPTDRTVRVRLSSPVTPPVLATLDITSGHLSPSAALRIDGHSPADYTVTLIEARSADGTLIPVTVAYRPDVPALSPRPAVLAAYGAYGAPTPTEFNVDLLPLLSRGFVVAIAHVRGSGGGGPAWHAAGRLERKPAGREDFIGAAEALRQRGWGLERRLAAVGRSAGAVIVAGAAATSPDLFGAIVLDAPFIDVAGALTDETRPLSVRDRAEWGDPRDPLIAAALRRYAPFELPVTAAYPPTLITVGQYDQAVDPLEGARWLDRLAQTGPRHDLLLVSSGTHAGPTTRTEQANVAALTATFIVATCGPSPTWPPSTR